MHVNHEYTSIRKNVNLQSTFTMKLSEVHAMSKHTTKPRFDARLQLCPANVTAFSLDTRLLHTVGANKHTTVCGYTRHSVTAVDLWVNMREISQFQCFMFTGDEL